MREIKFRGQDINFDIWLVGSLVKEEDRYFIVDPDKGYWDSREVKKETVGQYTGLKDKNEKGIYEGDILQHQSGERGFVKYRNGCFVIDYGNNNYSSLSLQIRNKGLAKVIGNIYENPNLLVGSN